MFTCSMMVMVMAPLAIPRLNIEIKEYWLQLGLEPTTFERFRRWAMRSSFDNHCHGII